MAMEAHKRGSENGTSDHCLFGTGRLETGISRGRLCRAWPANAPMLKSVCASSTPKGTSSRATCLLIYSALLTRDEMTLGLDCWRKRAISRTSETGDCGDSGQDLCCDLGVDRRGSSDLPRLARRKLRELAKGSEEAKEIKRLSEMFFRVARVSGFAFERPEISQEEIAEHLKRIRNDYCAGTLRDSFNKFVPQPVGPRRVHIARA